MEFTRRLMDEAFQEAEKSPCLKKKVGCVLYDTKAKTIVGSGFGGPTVVCETCVRKVYDWQQDGCWSIHSELTALFDYFNKNGYTEDLSHIICIVTHGPCDQCIKYLEKFKVKQIIFGVPYHNDYSKWTGRMEILELTDEGLVPRN